MATEYGNRLKAAVKQSGLTQTALAKKAGIGQGTLSELMSVGHGSGKTVQLAEACGVNAHWLATGEGLMHPLTNTGQVRVSLGKDEGPEFWVAAGAVPLISWVRAGAWHEVADPYAVGDAEEWLPCPVKHGPRTYCLRVRGDSMNNPGGRPSYANGDIIFVDPDRGSNHGDRVIVRLDDQAEATFKQLHIEDGRKMLKALNPDWVPKYIEINGNATVTGVVIGKWVPE